VGTGKSGKYALMGPWPPLSYISARPMGIATARCPVRYGHSRRRQANCRQVPAHGAAARWCPPQWRGGFMHVLQHCRPQRACAQAAMRVGATCAAALVRRASQGDAGTDVDHGTLLYPALCCVPCLLLLDERRGQRRPQERFEPGPMRAGQINCECGGQRFSTGMQVLHGRPNEGDG
jgi:hypothetical protein